MNFIKNQNKFRGKVRYIPKVPCMEIYRGVNAGEWVFGSLLLEGETASICVDYGDWHDGPFLIDYSVDLQTVGQNTGLCDLDKEELYVGDLITDSSLTDSDNDIFVLVRENNCFLAKLARNGKILNNIIDPLMLNEHSLKGTLQKVGNIYDNPELIGGF